MLFDCIQSEKFYLIRDIMFKVASLVAQVVKNLPAMQGRYGFDPWVGKIPLEKQMATHSSILA